MEDHVPRHAQMGAWVLINDRWYNSKHMVGESACVGVLFTDAFSCFVHQQAIENIGCFADRGGDGLDCKGRKLIFYVGICLQRGRVASITGQARSTLTRENGQPTDSNLAQPSSVILLRARTPICASVF